MNSIPNPASLAPSGADSDAVLFPSSAISVITEEEGRTHRNWSSFFAALRAFVSRLVDDSAYRGVCLGREISVIFTSNGPLVYRLEMKNDVQNEPARSSRDRV
ncbi:MAG TPA: hypothetical protein VFO40_08170 [Chthoniobacterales bacterium]|nr:hypothetical protein [Chthoniobacterales bacterium]